MGNRFTVRIPGRRQPSRHRASSSSTPDALHLGLPAGSSRRCFTARIGSRETGIGDQIYQTQVVYNLGRACGWEYLHDTTPTAWINRDRTGPETRFDYHGLLGLTEEQRLLSSVRNPRFLEVDAKDLLAAFVSGRRRRDDPDERIVRVSFNGWFYGEYESCPADAAIPCAHQLDIRRKYELARSTDPIALPFRHGTIPIVVFLRLMELIWYEVRGEPFFPCFPRNDEVKQFVTAPSRALPLLHAVIEALRPYPCEVWVYSDGLPERSWLIHRITLAGTSHENAVAQADRALAFQEVEMARFAECGVPTHFETKGSVELIRETVHAFSRAPFALNSRACHLGQRTVRTGFPDVGQRDPAFFPVITPDQSPASVATRLNEFLSNAQNWAREQTTSAGARA